MKNKFKKIITIIKKFFSKKKNILITGAVLTALVVILLFFCLTRKMSSVEKITLTNTSNDIMPYLNDIDSINSSLDEFIIYSLNYSYNELGTPTLSTKEIVKILNERFNIKVTEKQIEEVGVSPLLMENNITYSPNTSSYSYVNSTKTNQEIAETKIYYYVNKKIKKKNSHKYVITYDKYVISNPYEILNYYDAKNNEEGKESKYQDTTDIYNYLTGKETLKVLNKYLNEEILTSIAKKETTIKVTYEVIDDNIVITNIK